MSIQNEVITSNTISSLRVAAETLRKAGFTVLPVRAGEKRPAVKTWSEYQTRPMTDQEFDRLFAAEPAGFGIITGRASKGVECIDIDLKNDPGRVVFTNFTSFLKNVCPELLGRLVKETTPSGGFHLLYRVDEPLKNSKLARAVDQREAVLETRGEGGFLKIYPSVGYGLVEGSPAFTDIPSITTQERDRIWAIAQSCDATAELEKSAEEKAGRPGDDFNARCDALPFLDDLGWNRTGHVDGRGNHHFTRPGKDGGTSGTWHPASETFHCFTSSTSLPTGPHSAFSVLAHSKFGGDFSKAAQHLRTEGYGDQESKKDEKKDPPILLRGREGLPTTKWALETGAPPILIPNLLRVGNRLIVGAGVKVGKSILVNNLAFALAEGREWLGKKLEAKNVLLVDLEVDVWELSKRLFGLAEKDGNGHAVYPENLFRLSLRKRPDLLNRGRLLDVIRKYDEEHGFDVIVIDCLYQVLDGLDENSNSDMAMLGNWFSALEERGAAVVAIHHFGKGESHAKSLWDRFRGASSLAALFDAAITLAPHEKKDHVIVEFGARSFAEDNAMVIKYDPFPRLVVAEGEDASKYRLPGRQASGSDALIDEIHANSKVSTSSLAEKFNVTQQTVRDRAKKAGLKPVKTSGGQTQWTTKKDGQMVFLGASGDVG